jgi:cytochrome c oxidase assembly factor CtaG
MTTMLAAKVALGSFQPVQLVLVGLTGLPYFLRVRSLARAGRPVAGVRQTAFYSGLALILIAFASPIGPLSDQLLFAHMIEHLLMGDIGALLITLGLTGPVIAPLLRIRAIDRLRALAHPAVALPLWAVDLYAWHVPVLYQAALRHEGIHALEHACFIAFGINMWMCLFGPLPMPSWFGNGAKLVYIMAVRLLGAVLGNVLLWSGTVFYPFYRAGDALWHVSPVADQSYAGAVMMVESSVLTVCLFGWLFMKTARESEERQRLLELASALGVELTEQRARRAVAAGRGEELRLRLEGAGARRAAPPSAGAI